MQASIRQRLHAIVADAIFTGMESAVRDFKELIQR